jgi:hypothetical protein
MRLHMLSQKSHCHCLSARLCDSTLCQEMEKLNIEIVPQGTLTNITVESTLQGQIIAAQKHNKGMAHIREKLWSERHHVYWVPLQCTDTFTIKL